ncbi:MAG TPA: YciI family protein [Acidobacteriaceae bacterium]|nr:YciI family protein [Acidobacteriaceae bacterium]
MAEAPSYFFLKLIPCRPSFAFDMTAEEREIMQQHVAYWKTHMDEGKVVVYGPVMDPAGPYGIGVVESKHEDAIRAFIDRDPASRLNTYEFHPMRAVFPD